MNKRSLILIIALVIFTISLYPDKMKFKTSGGARAVSLGNGKVSIFWIPVNGIWPAGGFRIKDNSGRILVNKILPFQNLDKLKTLSKEEISWLKQLKSNPSLLYRENSGNKNERIALILKAVMNPEFSKGLGLMCTLTELPAKKQSFRIIGLNSNNRPDGMVMRTVSVNSHKQDSVPSAPESFKADISHKGVMLDWNIRSGKKKQFVYFIIERSTNNKDFLQITEKPLLIAKDAENISKYTDRNPVEGQIAQYRLRGIDLFGRSSKPALISVKVPVLSQLLPPSEVKAEKHKNSIHIAWSDKNHPEGTRYMLERADNPGGPFVSIIPQGATKDSFFLDSEIYAEKDYYYRVRTISIFNKPSPPSVQVHIYNKSKLRPDKVKNIKTSLGLNRVNLKWDTGDFSVTGYIIEILTNGQWQRINKKIWTESEFVYRYNTDNLLNIQLRVIAVGRNNKLSEPSKTIVVNIRKVPCGTPEILSVKQIKDKNIICIEFPQDRKDVKFIVRRCSRPYSEGLVISPPLRYNQKEFADNNIQAGQTYWYRVQATGPDKWKSKLSEPVKITVKSSTMPIPPKPEAKYKSTPFSHVLLNFNPPEKNLLYIIERRAEGDKLWSRIASACTDTSYIDTNPPRSETLLYRLRYIDAASVTGEASEPVRISR